MSSTRPHPEMPPEPLPILAGAVAQQCLATVLLVEDEDFVRQVTAEVLTSGGYDVLCARHAAEAMRVFQGCNREVHLLLTDVVLPGRTGNNLARDLQALCPALKTVFISGYPENAVTNQELRKPGVTYLPKPFSLESLLRTVRQALA